VKRYFTKEWWLQLVPSVRWTTIVLNALFFLNFAGIAFVAWMANLTTLALVAGFGCGGSFWAIVHLTMFPGLAERLGKHDEAMLKAEIERNIQIAYSEFAQAHPELEMQLGDIRFRQ